MLKFKPDLSIFSKILLLQKMQLDFLINLMYITHFGQNCTYVVYRKPSSKIKFPIFFSRANILFLSHDDDALKPFL